MIIEIIIHDGSFNRRFFQIFTPPEGQPVLLTRLASIDLPESVKAKLDLLLSDLSDLSEGDGFPKLPKIEPLSVELAQAPKL